MEAVVFDGRGHFEAEAGARKWHPDKRYRVARIDEILHQALRKHHCVGPGCGASGNDKYLRFVWKDEIRPFTAAREWTKPGKQLAREIRQVEPICTECLANRIESS